MDEITKLLPALPLWVSIPIIIVAVVVTLWPKILQAITEFSAASRTFQREKMRLELLKLHYEIEALKKDKGLAEMPPLLDNTPAIAPTESPSQVPARGTLSKFQQFAYGAAGALLPIALNFVVLDYSANASPMFLAGLFLRLLLFALIAGIASALLARTLATKTNCFLVGLSVTLVLTVVVQAQSIAHQREPQRMSKMLANHSLQGTGVKRPAPERKR